MVFFLLSGNTILEGKVTVVLLYPSQVSPSGLYKWAELSWSEAGEYFQRALTVYLNRDEPELVPLSAALTMLCYLQVCFKAYAFKIVT